jgi:hypothetical protein
MDPRLRLFAEIVQVGAFVLLIFGLVALAWLRWREAAPSPRSRVTSRVIPPRPEPRSDIFDLPEHPIDRLVGGIADGLAALGRRAWDHRRYDEAIEEEDGDEAGVAAPVAAMQQNPAKPIATPQNDRNATLRVAEDATLAALAALILESRSKGFQNGVVPETRGLTRLFGVKVSSEPRSEYQRLRRRLQEELARQNPAPESHITPIAQRETRARFD